MASTLSPRIACPENIYYRVSNSRKTRLCPATPLRLLLGYAWPGILQCQMLPNNSLCRPLYRCVCRIRMKIHTRNYRSLDPRLCHLQYPSALIQVRNLSYFPLWSRNHCCRGHFCGSTVKRFLAFSACITLGRPQTSPALILGRCDCGLVLGTLARSMVLSESISQSFLGDRSWALALTAEISMQFLKLVYY